MLIEQAANRAAAHARRTKENSVRRTKHGPVDTNTMIMCYRGDTPAAMIELPPDRDTMLRVASFAATAFAADVLAMSFDTYGATGQDLETARTDPRTGEPWAENAMQSYVEERGFDGLITEVMMTMVVNRADDARTVHQPYQVDGRAVTWLPDDPHKDGQSDGHVPSVLKAIMNRKTVEQMLVTHAPEWARQVAAEDPDKARWLMDVSAVNVLKEKATCDMSVCLFAKPGSVQAQLYRTRLGRSDVVNPGNLN